MATRISVLVLVAGFLLAGCIMTNDHPLLDPRNCGPTGHHNCYGETTP